MTISQKITVAIAAFLTLTVVIGGISVYQIITVGEIVGHIANEELPAVRYSGAIRAEIIDFRNRETQLLITHSSSEIDETLGRQTKNVENLKKQETEYTAVAIRPEQQQLLSNYRQSLAIYMKTHEQLVALVRAGETERAIAYFRGEQRVAFRNLLPVIDKIVEDSITSSDTLKTKATEVRQTAKLELLSAILIAAIIGVGMGMVLHSSVVSPLRKLRDAVVRVSDTKDFTQPIRHGGNDELAETASAVNQLCAAMHDTLRDFSGAITQLASMGSQLFASAQQVSGSSQSQSESASSMAASVEELTVSVNQVADNAQALAKAAQDSDVAAGEGSSVMVKTIEQIRDIGSRIKETAGCIKALGESSREITSIVEVIRDVADQTNLLALNAAIEAARAGEQGRGFAVVADEVRKLAERTALATQDISSKISAIQQGTQAAGVQMDLSVEQVSNGMAGADEAVSAVGRIKEDVARVEAEVNSISAALREQGQASNEIAGRVEQVAQISEENCRSAEETASLARGLANLTDQLRQTAARYKV